MDMNNEWYLIDNGASIDTPAVVIYRERVQHNIDLALQMVPAYRLRPHVKTHKCKEILQMMLQSGITRFKCATIAEAEMLASAAAPDVLLAYQPVGPKVQRLISLIRKYRYTNFSCLVDERQVAENLSRAALQASICIPVYIDLNVGMNRSGIQPADAVDLWMHCRQLRGLQLTGLHVYDGHIGDADPARRKERCDAAFAPVLVLKEELAQRGFAGMDIIAGGSPTFPIHAAREEVTCSPGTFVYWDHNYANLFPDQPFLPAALVVTRVVSLPDPSTLCTDLGHKSIASENELGKRVCLLNAPGVTPIAHSEEHLVLHAEKDHGYEIGSVLYGLPFHVCPTIALYESSVVVIQGQAVTEWRHTARDRKIFV